MYCKNCGKEIADDAIFCQYCGSAQTDELEKKETIYGKKLYKFRLLRQIYPLKLKYIYVCM